MPPTAARPLAARGIRQLLLPRPSRSYYSAAHPRPPTFDSGSGAERAILSAAYRHVPAHGFGAQSLSLGARDAGYPDISTAALPDGAFGLVRWHLASRREALSARARELFGDEGDRVGAKGRPGVAEKVELLAWERLLANSDVIGRWQEALAIMAQPSYIPASMKELALLSDEIWYLAGDGAVDPSWYTKRGSLSAIYATSELFMTNDKSPGFTDTRAFLHRRLDETIKIGGVLGSVGQWVGFTASAGVNVLRSKGLRI